MEYTVLLVVEVLSALGLIGLVLLQQGKGADVGASFGAGASQTIFGSSGSGNFMTRMTAIFATVFFATSLGLAYVSGKAGQADGFDFSGVIESPASSTSELPLLDASDAEALDTDALPSLEEEIVDDAGLPALPAVAEVEEAATMGEQEAALTNGANASEVSVLEEQSGDAESDAVDSEQMLKEAVPAEGVQEVSSP